jgi:hypothetical protein
LSIGKASWLSARWPAASGPAGFQAGADAWRRFVLTLVLGAAALTVGTLATAYMLDPFDTGRSPLIEKSGVRPQGPRTAGASRGRDPAFNAAIIGNSQIQLVSPERLKALTGLSFVQLSVPATGPKEQFVVVDWFMRHHRQARALVISADRLWCHPELVGSDRAPFPYWLYSHGPLEYWRGLLRRHVVEEIPRRIAYLLSKRPVRAPPDGYWDYEPVYAAGRYMADPARRAALERRSDDYIRNATGRFPAADHLRDVAGGLPSDTALVLVFPPTYRSLLPTPGSPGDLADRACKAALAAAVAGRPNTAVLDWRRNRPEVHDPDQFFDGTHYRRPLAEKLESEISDALGRRAPGPP